MDQLPQYPAFQYPYSGSAPLRRSRKIMALVLLIATPFGFMIFPPIGVGLFIGSLIAFFARSKKLILGPRYLLCGPDIVYYANVTKLILSEMNGTLNLQSASGKTFVLERDKFPTNARKSDKVKKNKAAKFAKVSGKIIEKVQKQAPAVECIGLAPR